MTLLDVADAKPPESEVEEGTYAIRVDGKTHLVFRYDAVSPFRAETQWRKIDQYQEDQAPPIDLQNAKFIEDDNEDTWVFASEITPKEKIKEEKPRSEAQFEEGTNESFKDYYQYAIEINGKEIVGKSQSDIFANAIEAMIENHELLNYIDIPYMPGYKNAIINDKPEHPDERKMERAKEIAGGYYISSKITASQKMKHLRDLADRCGVSIEFIRGWEEDE